MAERRSQVRAALRTFVTVAAVILLVHGVAVHGGHAFASLTAQTAAPLWGPSAETAPETAPEAEDADHDGCPKPPHQPCAAGWVKTPAAPTRHGGQPSRRPRSLGEVASSPGGPVAAVSAPHRTRSTGPLLQIFRC